MSKQSVALVGLASAGIMLGAGVAHADYQVQQTTANLHYVRGVTRFTRNSPSSGIQKVSSDSTKVRTSESIGPYVVPLVCKFQAQISAVYPNGGGDKFTTTSSLQTSCAASRWKAWSEYYGQIDPNGTCYKHKWRSNETGNEWQTIGSVCGA